MTRKRKTAGKTMYALMNEGEIFPELSLLFKLQKFLPINTNHLFDFPSLEQFFIKKKIFLLGILQSSSETSTVFLFNLSYIVSSFSFCANFL